MGSKMIKAPGTKGPTLHYRVKWVGYPEAESTWEPASTIDSDWRADHLKATIQSSKINPEQAQVFDFVRCGENEDSSQKISRPSRKFSETFQSRDLALQPTRPDVFAHTSTPDTIVSGDAEASSSKGGDTVMTRSNRVRALPG